jgi:heat shock protein HtpX
VTTGIRRILNREELSAVLAHEMAHVGNRDTLIMAVVATIAGAISMLAMLAQFSAIFGGMFGGREGRDNIIGLLIIAIVMPIAAALVRAAVSRTREFQADATGAHNCGNPLALASALQKLERGAEARPMRVAEGASHLFIVNPLRGANFANLFSTHPPTAERVQRLTSMNITPRF